MSMKSRILMRATWSVCSLILAKQTLNHPGSEQWQEEPGDILSFTSCNIIFHNPNSSSLVFSFNKFPKFIQQNNPAFPLRHSIPIPRKPWIIIPYLFLSLSRFVRMYFSVKLVSDSIVASSCCVWDEIKVKLDILLAVVTTLSLYEYIVPTLKPGSPRSFERL